MPVTFTLAKHEAKDWTKPKVASNDALFAESCPQESEGVEKLIQSSLSRRDFRTRHISSSTNGLIWAVFEAYSKHHHLVLRPEDIWSAILCQVGFYINANAEELRDYFVSHQGRKELVVLYGGDMNNADFGAIAREMTSFIQENVKEPRLREWIMPSFSTTTDTDRVVAAILMMGSMQKYFSFKCEQECGIPSVTLLGERKDWENILLRVDYLAELGAQPTVFAELLKPILRNFISSFDDQGRLSAETSQFWGRIVNKNYEDSGEDFLSGWITAFGYWDEKGAAKHITKDLTDCDGVEGYEHYGCVLEGVRYPCIGTESVPAGFASVPVVVEHLGTNYQTKMVAGLIGMEAKRRDRGATDCNSVDGVAPNGDGEGKSSGTFSGLDTVQPLTGWFMHKMKTED